MNKDVYIKENSRLQAIVDDLEVKDTKIRKEISIALGAGYVRKQTYGYSSEEGDPIAYSWYAIFREIGKLLERKNDADHADAISHHSNLLSKIQEEISELREELNPRRNQ